MKYDKPNQYLTVDLEAWVRLGLGVAGNRSIAIRDFHTHALFVELPAVEGAMQAIAYQ